MKVLCFQVMLVCSAASAQDGWIELARTNEATAYTNGARTRAPSGHPAVWVYFDYRMPQPDGARSLRIFYAADCAGMQTRALTASSHSGVKATGSVISPGGRSVEWEPVPSASVMSRIWEYVCTGT